VQGDPLACCRVIDVHVQVLFSGFGPLLARVVPAEAIMFATFEATMLVLEGSRN